MNAIEFSAKFNALLDEAAASEDIKLGQIISVLEMAKISIVTEQIAAMKSAAAVQMAETAQKMYEEATKIITPN